MVLCDLEYHPEYEEPLQTMFFMGMTRNLCGLTLISFMACNYHFDRYAAFLLVGDNLLTHGACDHGLNDITRRARHGG